MQSRGNVEDMRNKRN